MNQARPSQPFLALLCALAILLVPATASASIAPDAEASTRALYLASPHLVGAVSHLNAGLHRECEPNADELAADFLLVPRGPAGAVERTVSISQRNLQKGFTKHGADFGLSGNWNPGKAAEFGQAVRQHVSSPGVRVIEGSYRGNPVTHFVDPKTGLNVIVDPAGNYVSGWRLGAEQLEGVLSSGRLF